MKLSNEEFDKLKKAIEDAFPTLSDLKDLALDRGVVLDQVVALPAVSGVAAGELIHHFDGYGLIGFIEAAMKRRSNSRTLRALGEELIEALRNRKPWYAPPVLHETCFVQNRLPFVNRTELRQFLLHFPTPQGSSILLIKGTSKSGKSYSFRLAKFLRDAPDAQFNLASVDATDDTTEGADLTPELLLTRIASEAGFDSAKIKSLARNSRATTVMYNWLVEKTVNSKKELWIFLDGFGRRNAVPRTTRSLIDKIALNGWKSKPAIRLILTNYSIKWLPASSRMDAQTEEIEPLQRKDVAAFFRKVYDHRRETFQEGAIEAILQKIGTGMSLEGDLSAPILHEAMSKVIPKLFPETPA
jgi:hypothetical protein